MPWFDSGLFFLPSLLHITSFGEVVAVVPVMVLETRIMRPGILFIKLTGIRWIVAINTLVVDQTVFILI